MPENQKRPSAGTSILIIDDDQHSYMALHHVLDSEGWRVHIVPLASQGLAELARGEWTLAIVNVALTGLEGDWFTTLTDLSQSAAAEGGHARVRVLFLVPELLGGLAQPVLERLRLPYVLKPVNLHDFLEKVSDLLLEAQAIKNPIRRVRYEYAGQQTRKKDRRAASDRRETPMFASREDYQPTEEEIAEFEKQEKQQEEAAQKKAEQKKSLGG